MESRNPRSYLNYKHHSSTLFRKELFRYSLKANQQMKETVEQVKGKNGLLNLVTR